MISVYRVLSVVSLLCFRIESRIFVVVVKQHIKDMLGLHNVYLLTHPFQFFFFFFFNFLKKKKKN